MSLVRWFRKNNTKIMAVVVIVIMFGFVAGSYLSYLARSGPRPRDTVAYFLDDRKITRSDLQAAARELEILRSLRADMLLRNQDMQGIFLAELLFSEGSGRGGSAAVIEYVRRAIARNRYRISPEDIASVYRRSAHPTVFWLLLKEEAHRCGVRVANADAGKVLAAAIPRLYEQLGTPGVTYAQVIGQLVRSGISEDEALAAFGDLMGVLQYAQLVCGTENLTTREVMHLASRQSETMDVEFVEFDSEVFARDLADPPEDKLIEQFNKYKRYLPASVSEENPHGFGYRLPARVGLEYIAVKLDDVASIVEPPTHEETGEFYRKNKDLFTRQVPSDPNDPNSPKVEELRSYAEVVDAIRQRLLNSKISSKAELILQQAKTLAEPNLAGTGLELEELTSEQFKERLVDYNSIAEKLSEQHNVKLYVGRTGLLSAEAMQLDRYLGRLAVEGYGYRPVGLTQMAFAVDEVGTSKLGPFDAPKPRLYETIGPAKDAMAFGRSGLPTSGRISAVVRVVEAYKEGEPADINEAFSTHGIIFDPNQDKNEDDFYSVRQKVTEDLKELAALDTTRTKAEQFIDLAASTDWDTALNRFNQLYGGGPNEPNVFRLDFFTRIARTSAMELSTLAVQNEGNPAAKFFLNQAKVEAQLTEKLYSLVPSDSNTPETLPVVVEFEPTLSFFCIKSLALKRLWREDFERLRPLRFYRQAVVRLQSLAPVHFKPDNILERLRFRPAEPKEKAGDANAPPDSEASS